MIELINYCDMLCTKASDIVDDLLKEWYKDDNPALIYHYPDGDVDTINPENPNMEHLIVTLFDARESGKIPADCTKAKLPNGTIVEF